MDYKKRLLLLDFNNVFYRGFAVHRTLEYGGIPTGGVFGFIWQLVYLMERFPSDHVCICMDSPISYRRKILPTYKANRVPLDEELKQIFAVNREVIDRFLGIVAIPKLCIEGLEADDLIAALAANYDDHQVVVVSNDSDLFQILREQDRIAIWRGMGKSVGVRNKGGRLYDGNQFYDDYPISVHKWATVAAISGGHNGLPGIDGIGVARAVQYLRGEAPRGIRDKIDARWDVVEASLPLATLPFPLAHGLDKLRVPEVTPSKKITNLMSFLGQVGIKVVPRMRQAFDPYLAPMV